MNLIKKTWAQIPTDKKTIKQFGFILVGFLLVVLPLVGNVLRMVFAQEEFRYSMKWPIAAAIALIINLFISPLMKLIYQVAMLVARGIGFVMMRVLLFLMFYLVISPLSLVMRFVFRKDMLDERLDRGASTYWKKREPKPSRLQYEKLY